jgi:quinol monooxygenase YgiN
MNTTPTTPTLIVVRFDPKPGLHAEVEALLRTMVPATRSEEGNRRYDLFKSVDPTGAPLLFLVEQYGDDAAIAAHRETPHYKAYRAAVLPLLQQPPSVQLLHAIDCKPY